MQQLDRQRCARQFGHADRRGVDQPVRFGNLGRQVRAHNGSTCAEMAVEVVDQRLGTRCIDFEQHQPLDPFAQ
ncbi:hypothetical protein D3C75_1188380 [compost metagenome]